MFSEQNWGFVKINRNKQDLSKYRGKVKTISLR